MAIAKTLTTLFSRTAAPPDLFLIPISIAGLTSLSPCGTSTGFLVDVVLVRTVSFCRFAKLSFIRRYDFECVTREKIHRVSN